MTKPENFRRDRDWPCPIEGCGAWLHSPEQLQLHYASHTPEEKDAAWAKVPAFFAKQNRAFRLVEVSYPCMQDAGPEGMITLDQS